jgi:hypothetical protein
MLESTAREEPMAQYKTIVLELLQEQYPALHEQLRRQRMLLQSLNDCAASLKRHHETWMDRLSAKRPDSDPAQIASEAMELALPDLRDDLPSGPEAGAPEPLSLDAAMSYVRPHTPNA